MSYVWNKMVDEEILDYQEYKIKNSVELKYVRKNLPTPSPESSATGYYLQSAHIHSLVLSS